MATPTEPATARTRTVALVGIHGHIVDVEAHLAPGLPGLQILGLRDDVAKETRDRVRAATANSGESWLQRRTTVTLSPVSLPNRGGGHDLAIAVAALAVSGMVPAEPVSGCVFFGELALDGRIRPIPGVLPAVLAAADAGCAFAVVPAANAAEASLVPGITVVGVSSLSGLLVWLRGEVDRADVDGDDQDDAARAAAAAESLVGARLAQLDLCDVIGRPTGRWAVEVCAAGGHGLWLLGQPGAGATMLAERLPGVLPVLDRVAALEVSAVRSVAGMLHAGEPFVTRPPFVAPHHTASRASLIGGGSAVRRPGAASLAHRGVLFLDEAAEFGRSVLDSLRQPLETGEVAIARGAVTTRYPARFELVAATRPCPCAQPADTGTRSPLMKRRYLGRVSQLLDYIDVRVELNTPTRGELLDDRRRAESSAVVAQRVAMARDRAQRRLDGTPWRTNAEVPARYLRTWLPLGPGVLRPIEQAYERGAIAARDGNGALRVAWTLADLAGNPQPTVDQVEQALAFRRGVAS